MTTSAQSRMSSAADAGALSVTDVLGPGARNAFDLVQDLVFVVPFDPAGRRPFLFANRAASETLGWSPEEIRELAPVDLVAPSSWDRVEAAGTRLERDGETVIHHILQAQDGGRIPVEFQARVVHVAPEPIVVAIGRDLRKSAPVQARIEEDHAMLAAVVDAVEVEVAILDGAGTIVRVNEAWNRVALRNGGQPENTGEGVNYFEACASDPAGREVLEGMESVRDGWSDRFEFEYGCETPRGTLLFRMTVTPWSKTVPRGLVVLHEDVTAARAAEELLIERVGVGEAMVRRKRERMEDERRDAATELESRVGQGLAALHLDLTALQSTLGAETEAHEDVVRAQSLVSELVDATLDLQSELRPPMLDVLGFLPAFEWYVESVTRDRGLEVEWRTDPELHRRAIEPRRALALYRIGQEAVDNVVRHAEATRLQITVRGTSDIELVVEDDGVGIPESVLRSGPHLGLLEMQERLDEFDGTVSIDRSPLGGCRVRAVLPNAEGES